MYPEFQLHTVASHRQAEVLYTKNLGFTGHINLEKGIKISFPFIIMIIINLFSTSTKVNLALLLGTLKYKGTYT